MHKKRFFGVFLSVALVALMAGFALPAPGGASVKAVDLNPKIASGQMVQKIDAFAVIFDTTLSMNDAYKTTTKLNQGKALITLFNDTIPNLKLMAAARAFGQFANFGDSTSQSLFGIQNYSKSALPQAIAPYTAGRGFSPLNAALDGVTADLRNQSGKMAVVVFSDGEDMQQFDPVAAARRMKGAYGDRICIYTVHLGDSEAGRKLLQQVADAGQCGAMVTGDSIAAPAGMASFVERVFLTAKPPEPVKPPPPPVVEREMKIVREAAPVVTPAPPPPAPAPAPKEEPPVSIALNLEFDTNKAVIKPKYDAEIKKVADFMAKYPKSRAVIEGHTDNVGKDAANVKLSQRRAESVKAYLVKKFGIDAARIKAVGYGPSKPIADNKTKEGRQKNRRVHAVFSHH